MSIINLPSGSSIHRTIEEVDTINKNATQMKEISSSVSLIGFDLFTSSLKENAAAVFLNLKIGVKEKQVLIKLLHNYLDNMQQIEMR